MSGQKTLLCAGITFYNDSLALWRCLKTLKHFDYIFCVDGKFKDFYSESDLSDEGIRQIIKSYPNTILYDAPNLTEPEKRTINFKLAKEYKCDWLLVIDSDEWVQYFDYNKLRKFEGDKDFYFIQLHKAGFVYPITWCPRLFNMRDREIVYGKEHIHIFINGQFREIGIRYGKPLATFEDLILYSDDRLRDPDYNKALDEYQKSLGGFERSLKYPESY